MVLRRWTLALSTAGLLFSLPASAQAPLKITPQVSTPPKASSGPKPAPAQRVQRKSVTKRSASKPSARQTASKPARPPAAKPVSQPPSQAPEQTISASPAWTPPPVSGNEQPDLAFGAFQRGHFLTAFAEATRRVSETGDAKAMALLGELFANGFGVMRDDKKAADWYALAADRGDREATFALAMFRLSGRSGPKDPDSAARLLAQAAKLGHVA